MKHHPYAVFFDVLWDVTNPRGIDADDSADTDRRQGGRLRRRWLKLRRANDAPEVELAPAAHTRARPARAGAGAQAAALDDTASADARSAARERRSRPDDAHRCEPTASA